LEYFGHKLYKYCFLRIISMIYIFILTVINTYNDILQSKTLFFEDMSYTERLFNLIIFAIFAVCTLLKIKINR